MRRSLAALVAVVGLVAAASGAAVSASTRAAADGVTKDEIKIGITYPDLEAIRSVTNTNHGDYEKAYRAVIDDLNKQGGVNGRKLVPVFAAKRIEVAVVATWHRHDGLGSLRDSEDRRKGRWQHLDFVEA